MRYVKTPSVQIKLCAITITPALFSQTLSILIGLVGIVPNSIANEVWPNSLTRECKDPNSAWIWCDDFEIDRSRYYFEGKLKRVASIGLNESSAAAFQFKSGLQRGGGLKLAFGKTPHAYFRPVDDGSRHYREIYWRMFVWLPKDWKGNGADKLSRATILANKNWAQAMIAHIWSGSDPGSRSEYLYIDPASGTDAQGRLRSTQYNDFKRLRWLGAKLAPYPLFARRNFAQWQCVEGHVVLNDPGSSNGLFELYINGALQVTADRLNWVGNYQAYGLNAVFFENYWNNGSPADQVRYFDNLVVSQKYIGCGKNETSKEK